MAEAYLGLGWEQEAGDAAVNDHDRAVDFLRDVTTDQVILLHTQTHKGSLFGALYFTYLLFISLMGIIIVKIFTTSDPVFDAKQSRSPIVKSS